MIPGAAEQPAVRSALRFGQLQRRQLSIMFVDLAGSTELAARLDVEETRDILLAFLDTCSARIEAAHGYVARFMGDGLLAYFGYPEAHPEAASLAIHAALEIQSAMPRLNRGGSIALEARIGIATGEIMVGDIVGRGGAAECMVVGAAANLAARLQSAAQPGAVLACGQTRALAQTTFAYAATEPLELKGFSDDIVAFEVTGSVDSDRFRSRLGLGLAPMSGRTAELDQLNHCLAELRQGAQRRLITGEPGIGKSRLLHAFRSQAELPNRRWFSTTGAATAVDTPYFGLAQMVRRSVASDDTWDPQRDVPRLVQRARELGLPDDTLVRIAQTCGLPLGLHSGGEVISQADRRARLIDDCHALLARAAKDGPVVIAIEDAHWLDASTRQVLDELWPRLSDLPILIVATSRDPLDLGWQQHERLIISALDNAALADLVRHASGGGIDDAQVQDIVLRAQGVPLYAEELARLLSQAGSSAIRAVPASLADLLMSRLDRGEHGLAVAQLAALLGEDAFPAALAALAGFDSATLARALDRLEIDGVALPRRDAASPITLRHALFGEAALAAMPDKARRTAHLAAARLLAERDTPADRIARHFDAANDTAHAAEWWQRAGDLARRRRALPEACGAFERAIELTDADSAAMLPLQTAHFEVLQLRFGYGAAPTKAAGDRLRERVEAQGDLTEQLIAVAGQWAAASSGGQYDLANTFAARAPAIAHALGTGDALAAAAMIQLTARYRCGDLAGAEEAFQRGKPYFGDPVFTARTGGIPQVYISGSIVAWLLGDDAAFAERVAVLEAAPAVHSDPYSRAYLGQGMALGLVLDSQFERAEAAAAVSLELAEQHRFPQFQVGARIALGAARAGLGDAEGGVAMMREGLALIDGAGARSLITLSHAWLAEAELANGMPDYALGTLTRGQSLCPEERFTIPELIRLRARAEDALGRSNLHDALLSEALLAADQMGAVGWRRKILADLG